MTMYADDIEVAGGSAQAGEFELLPEGSYLLAITNIEPFTGTDYKTGEPRPCVKVIYTTAEHAMNGDWSGVEVSQICPLVKNMANDKAWLHQIWKAATGETPVEGGNYKLKSGLIGRFVIGNVIHKTNSQGSIWPRIKSVSPPPAQRRRGPAPAPVAIDEEPDDLEGA